MLLHIHDYFYESILKMKLFSNTLIKKKFERVGSTMASDAKFTV